jgi:ATP-dependent DNA helicase RecG
MAPTEILAAQHLATARTFGARAGLRCELLVGGMAAGERRRVRDAARRGDVDLVIGTHALLVEDVAFARLGLVVIDEQHRFGVLQRSVLREKGLHPHALVMTATPIPRTLALTVYGDLDVTVIPDRPPGRTPVRTRVASERQRGEVEERVRERLRRGERAYWVFPLVEDSETLDLPSAVGALEDLRKRVLPGFEVALLHGRQSAAEKAAALEAFRSGAAQVLASTSVVEVGLDVPEATVLVVERAERFGLAQLHQLRGRIGRGAVPAAAWFLAGPERLGWRRLRALAESESGFEIAEADLAIRGPGELAGLRQHGVPDLRIADLARDLELLARARRDAFALVERDPGLAGEEAAPFLPGLVTRYGGEARLLDVG